MRSLDAFVEGKLNELKRRHLYRALNETLREDGIWVERGGRKLLSFSCNDYLNFTQHAEIKRAAIAAIEEYARQNDFYSSQPGRALLLRRIADSFLAWPFRPADVQISVDHEIAL